MSGEGGSELGGRPWDCTVRLCAAAVLTADLCSAGLCVPCGRCRAPALSQPGGGSQWPRVWGSLTPPVQGPCVRAVWDQPAFSRGKSRARGPQRGCAPLGGVTDPEDTRVVGQACPHGRWGRPAPRAPSASCVCECVDGSDLVGPPGSPASRLVLPGSGADRSLACVRVRACMCVRAHRSSRGPDVGTRPDANKREGLSCANGSLNPG